MQKPSKHMLSKSMSCLVGFAILLFYLYLASAIVKIFAIAFPPALIGLILLCVSLQIKLFPKKFIEDIYNLMLNHIVLFFVPLTVGITAYIGLLKDNILSILLVVAVSTFISFTLTALLVENIIKYTKLQRFKGKHNA